MKRIAVVAGILRDDNGRVLIAERLGDDAMAGKWEFPGGKIGSGESAATALARELGEELGIEMLACTHFMSLEHDYDDRQVALDFYFVREWLQEPQGRDGQRLKWVMPSALLSGSMLAADVAVVDALRKL